MGARILELILTDLERRGSGRDLTSPIRAVTQVYSPQGDLIAERDRVVDDELTTLREAVRAAQRNTFIFDDAMVLKFATIAVKMQAAGIREAAARESKIASQAAALEEAEGTLEALEQLCARRPALASEPTLYGRVVKMIALLAKLDPKGDHAAQTEASSLSTAAADEVPAAPQS